MKLVFFGTSEFALKPLSSLKDSKHELKAIFTQPDKKGGRNLKAIESPVKKWAFDNNYPLYQPQNILDEKALLNQINADIFIVVGYGSKLADEIINLPQLYSINIHPSLLPEYRGAAPVNRAIIDGKEETGVTIFKVTNKIDAGDIILQDKIRIEKQDTNLTLDKKLSQLGARLLIEALDLIENNEVEFKPQNDASATYAPKLRKENGLIDFSKPADQIFNLIRGTKGWPSAFTYLNNKILKIHEAEIIETDGFKKDTKPGEIVKVKEGNGIIVKTHKGYLNILSLQLEGKKEMPSRQFILGHKIEEGDILGKYLT